MAGSRDGSAAASAAPPRRSTALFLGLLAVLMLLPVTLPVPVLRGLVHDRFGVSELQTSLFMSVNMVGALLAAPAAGALADRLGRHKALIVAALCADAACLWGLAAPVPFWSFLAIRFVEGCAHITALSLLLSVAAAVARRGRRGAIMGAVGSGITLGVALGAPLGGILGRHDVLRPLQVGGAILAGLAVLVALRLRDETAAGPRPGLRRIVELARRETSLLVPFAFAFVDRFTVGFFTTTFPLYMKRVFDLPVERIGMLLGMFLGPFFLLSYPCAKLAERTSRCVLVGGGSLAYGLALTSLGLWSVDGLPALMLGLGALSAVMFVPSLILVTDLAPSSIRATALGGFNAAGSLGFVVGPLVGGAVSQLVGEATTWRTGYGAAFAVAGAAQVACVLATWPRLRALVRAGL